jgi:hypothetical protein
MRKENIDYARALPSRSRDLTLFFCQNGQVFSSCQFEGGVLLPPLPFRPLNRSLGLLPSIALSRPVQVARLYTRPLESAANLHSTIDTDFAFLLCLVLSAADNVAGTWKGTLPKADLPLIFTFDD